MVLCLLLEINVHAAMDPEKYKNYSQKDFVRELQPIRDKDKYSENIAQHISEQMYLTMFQPLFRILGKKPEQTLISNALDRSSVTSALNSGIIWFYQDKFYGSFNSNIGKELRAYGANFNSLDKTYFIKISSLPMNIRASIGESSSKFRAQQDALIDTLNKSTIPPQIDFKEVNARLDSMFIDLNKQFSASIPKDLAVPMVMTPLMRDTISEEYTQNINMYIKDWYEQDIVKLRQRVEEAVSEGYRADHMRDILEAEYGVATRKASFLARQETSLLVSKYRETRYKDAGLNRYRWSTSHDIRVRHDHRVLNDRIFDWDHAPITDEATGARNNPGQDYNCRCVAIPIVE